MLRLTTRARPPLAPGNKHRWKKYPEVQVFWRRSLTKNDFLQGKL